MKTLITTAIILSRVDYGEADRILTLLTPDYGKLRLIAKGVRKIKSKLAGGIELFSVSDIVFIRGRSEIGTLVSTRLIRHYGRIVQDVNRTMLGYDIIKMLNRATEDGPEAEYFELMERGFSALANPAVPLVLLRTWFTAQLLDLSGHTPNLHFAAGGAALDAAKTYEFNFDDAAFIERSGAQYRADNIKFLRILFSKTDPAVIAKIKGAEALAEAAVPLVRTMAQLHGRF